MSEVTEATPTRRYTCRKWLQSSFVIVCAFGSLWTKTLDSTALVTLVLGALGVYATANIAEKKAQATS